MMPCISASYDVGPVPFVFRRSRMPYRNVVCNGLEIIETYANMLPRNVLVSMHKDAACVDNANFFEWAQCFVQYVRPVTADSRRVLLTYDGYRSHKCFRSLELFHQNNVKVYAIPTHSSRKTQPLDVKVIWKIQAQVQQDH